MTGTLISFHAALQVGCTFVLYSIADVRFRALGFEIPEVDAFNLG